ncbi:MAG: sugar ABC transporter substrate-binding protein [Cellulomonadaceae bacterium]|nr:sugar ABC transporter substrate-binding protein [Cellulomonadaceae bacterium]
MRRTQRVTVAALAVVALTAMTACGRGDTPAAGETSAAAVGEGAATGTITVWAMGTEGEALQDFAKGFTDENPDATVEVTAIPWDAAHDKISTAIAGDQVPDVSLIGTTWMGEFAATGALDPTPDLIDSASFFPGAWGSTEVGGTSYGVPWYVETRVLYQNGDLMEAAGVEAPTTWDDLTAEATAMQGAGATWGINLPPGQTGAWQTFMPFAWQAGAELTNADGTEITLDTPEMVEALTYYKGLFDAGLSPTDLPEGTLESDFVAGKIGSFVSGPWHLGLLADAGAENVVISTLPAGEQEASFIGGGNLGVFSSAENRDGAWKFVEWLSQPETQAAWYDAVKDLPAVSSAWDSGALASDEQLAVFGKQLETAVAPPSIPNWEQIADVVDTELENLIKTDGDPAQSAATMQQQAEAIGTGL